MIHCPTKLLLLLEVNNANALYAWIPAMHCCSRSHICPWLEEGDWTREVGRRRGGGSGIKF